MPYIVVSSLVAADNQTTAYPTTGLVAYYTFNNQTNDAINGNHAVIEGNGIQYVTGVHGNAIKFGGYNVDRYARLKVPTSSSLQFSSAASFSMWMRLDSSIGQTSANCSGGTQDGAFQTLIGKSNDRYGLLMTVDYQNNQTRLISGLSSDGKLGFESGGAATIQQALGNWIHVAQVFDATGAKLYLNGALAYHDARTPDFSLANSRVLYFGLSPGEGSCASWWYPLNGALDEVRIYNRGLTAAEVQELYQYPVEPTPTSIPQGDQYEPDNVFSQAKSIATNGSSQTHTIHLSGDEDWVKFDTQTGYRYVIETANLQGGADTFIGLFWDENNDNHADLILSDDNSAGGLASRIDWIATRIGTHYVKIRDTSPNKGSPSVAYNIRVTANAPQGDSYEPDNDFTQAKSIATNGSSQTHTIHLPGDEDWVKFDTQTGYRYVIETANLQGGADTFIGLFWDENNDNHADLILSDDNSAGGLASRIDWTATRTGTHYVKIRDTSPNRGSPSVTYNIRVTTSAPQGDSYEPDNDFTQARNIATNGSSQTHTIHLPGDEDWMKFDAITGYQYIIETFNLQGGADTVLGLFWDNQNDNHPDLLISDENPGPSRIVWVADQTATRWIKVRDTNTNLGGANVLYSVKVTASIPQGDQYEADNVFTQAKSIGTDGSTQTHTIHLPGDEDWVKFDTQTGYRYVIETASLQGGADTFIGLFWDENNDNHADLIISDDNSAGGLASRIDWTATRTGAHYVKIRDTSPSRGGTGVAYNIRITATAQQGDQLLKNSSFNEGEDPRANNYWQDNQVGSCFMWTYPVGNPAGNPSEGTRFLVAHRNGGTACTSFYQDVSRDPLQGETYTFSIDARAPANGVEREFDLVIWAIGGGCPEQQAQKRVVITNNSWTTHMVQLTIDNSCHQSLRAEVYLASNDGTQIVNYNFDNARLIGNERTSITGRVTRDLGSNQEIKVYTSLNGQSIETRPDSNGNFTLDLPAGQYVIAVDDQDRSVFVPGSIYVDTNNPPNLQFSGTNLNNFLEILENDSFESGPNQSWQWNGNCFRDSVALERSAGGVFHDSKALVTHGGGGANCTSFYQDVRRLPQQNDRYIFEIAAKAPTNLPEHKRTFEMQLFAIGDNGKVLAGPRQRFQVNQQIWTRHNVEITVNGNEYHTLRAEVYLMDNDHGQEIQYHFDHARLLGPKAYSVSGKVVREDGVTGISGAIVRLSGNGVVRSPVTIGASRDYNFTLLPNGAYQVSVEYPSIEFEQSSHSVTIANGDANVPDFREKVVVILHTLSGTVSDAVSRNEIEGATVTLINENTNQALTSVKSNSVGFYEIRNIDAEELYRLEISHSQYREWVRKIKLSNDQMLNIRLELLPPGPDEDIVSAANTLVNTTQNDLERLLSETQSIAIAGDYFAGRLEDRLVNTVIDVVADSFSLLTLGFSTAPEKEIVETAQWAAKHQWPGYTYSIGRTIERIGKHGAKERWIKTAFAESFKQAWPSLTVVKARAIHQEILLNGLAFYAKDALWTAGEIAAIEEAKETEGIKDFLKDMFGFHHELALQESVKSLNGLVKTYSEDIDELLDEVLHQVPELSDDEEAELLQDLEARRQANNALYRSYMRSSYTLQFTYDRAILDDSLPWWTQQWRAIASDIGVVALGGIIGNIPGAIVATGGVALKNLGVNFYEMNADQQMMSLGVAGLGGGTTYSTQIYANAISGLDLIRDRRQPSIATGLVEIKNQNPGIKFDVSEGCYYREPNSFSEVTIQNPNDFEIDYKVFSFYENSTIFNLADPVYLMSTNSVVVPAQSSKTVSVYYKHNSKGKSPDKGSSFTIQILGTTDTGVYLVYEETNTWPYESLPCNEVNSAMKISLNSLAEAQLIENPVRLSVFNSAEYNRYDVYIWTHNPFKYNVNGSLTQKLQSGISIINAGDGQVLDNVISWNVSLSPGEYKLYHFVFKQETGPNEEPEVSTPVLELSSTQWDNTVSFTTADETLQSQYPIQLSRLDIEKDTIFITVLNKSSMTSIGEMHWDLYAVSGQINDQNVLTINLESLESNIYQLMIPALSNAGIYFLNVDVEINDTRFNLASRLISITDLQTNQLKIYLPLINRD